MKKDTDTKTLEKKLLKGNVIDILCRISILCFYIVITTTSLDLFRNIIYLNLKIKNLIGVSSILVISLLCIRKIIEYKKRIEIMLLNLILKNNLINNTDIIIQNA